MAVSYTHLDVYKRQLLDCSVIKTNKTSQNLADDILHIISEWDLSRKTVTVITDMPKK